MYYPWLVTGEAGDRLVPPSGHVAGLIARTDLSQGVHRAPANHALEGVTALSNPLNETEHGILNDQGINAVRSVPGRGIRVFGARTLSSESEWRYLNVRRLLLMIEEAVEDANQWAAFEPNNPLLRQILTHSLNTFLETLWRQGALAGATPDAAYRVKCDFENNPQGVIDAGQLIAEIAVAPTVPFEFIRFRLGRTVAAVAVTE
jgi:phage tail sheath protein FI